VHANGRKVSACASRRGGAGREGDPPFAAHVALALRVGLSHSVPTLKNWEQGRRYPEAPAAAHLLAIKRKPKEVRVAVASVAARRSESGIFAEAPDFAALIRATLAEVSSCLRCFELA
jgi:hypothetical protein